MVRLDASDIAAWERICSKGLWSFVFWYGVCAFGGVLFVLLGGATVSRWLQSPASLATLRLELAFVAGACVWGGVLNSLLTWWLEENIYRKIVAARRRTVE